MEGEGCATLRCSHTPVIVGLLIRGRAGNLRVCSELDDKEGRQDGLACTARTLMAKVARLGL